MGTRGPKKKSLKDEILEGNPSGRKRGKIAIEQMAKSSKVAARSTTVEPKGLNYDTPPPVPEILKNSPEACQLWREITPQLVEMDVLATTDLQALIVLCDTWAIYCGCRDIASDPGKATFTTEKGYVGAHPAVAQMQAAVAALQKLWPKFGLTPLDRDQLGILTGGKGKKGGKSSLFNFLAGKPK